MAPHRPLSASPVLVCARRLLERTVRGGWLGFGVTGLIVVLAFEDRTPATGSTDS